MQVELICIGTELLRDKINTNLAYMGTKLSSIGLNISFCVIVGDTQADIEEVFRNALGRAEVVISTGGLGPTFDDLTREVVSKLLKKRLIFNKDIMHQIARHFAVREIEMPKGNEQQAYILQGAEILQNNIGTAPGQIVPLRSKKYRAKDVILLPGPPHELQPMFEKDVLPYLKAKYSQRVTKTLTIHTYGLPESKVNEIILPVVKKHYEGVEFAILAHQTIIDIRITVSGRDEMSIDRQISTIKTELLQLLNDYIYGENEQTLEDILAGLLIKNKKTLAVAESCTGGWISHRITNVPGSSVYFREGVVAYSNEAKMSLLGVKDITLKEYGAVSKEVALEMGQGVKRISGSDYGLSVTGIAGPGGATASKPVGLVYFALVTPEGERVEEVKFTGSREEIKDKAANYALNFLRKVLLQL